MTFGKVLLCILLPPLAVLDRGLVATLVVLVLTIAGWVPGVIAAFVWNMMPKPAPAPTVIIQQAPPPQWPPQQYPPQQWPPQQPPPGQYPR